MPSVTGSPDFPIVCVPCRKLVKLNRRDDGALSLPRNREEFGAVPDAEMCCRCCVLLGWRPHIVYTTDNGSPTGDSAKEHLEGELRKIDLNE